ncbi:MAG: hypothetical protein P1U46_04400 [Patescibacteria group bacterium]|nr:hypothetical protein [Patescibacteria group bacterium]
MYRKNMDKIYDCATTYIYVKSIESIEESIKNTPNLKTKLEKKLEDLKNRKIDDLDDKKCNIKKDNKEIYIKKYVLNQTTYELCRYNYYLSYLEEYNKNIGSSLPDYITKNENKQDYKEILLEDVLESYSFKKSKIDEEIQSSFEVFPKVFSAYSQYENYLTIHLYMDLILKQDYISIRELLHKSIKPINQL